MLVAARAARSVPRATRTRALGLLTLRSPVRPFAGSPDRPKAFGIFGAIAASGASVVLLLGGALTQALCSRWSLT